MARQLDQKETESVCTYSNELEVWNKTVCSDAAVGRMMGGAADEPPQQAGLSGEPVSCVRPESETDDSSGATIVIRWMAVAMLHVHRSSSALDAQVLPNDQVHA